MPLNECQYEGKPGWRWGQAGKCYVYTPGSEAGSRLARARALRQGVASGEFLKEINTEKGKPHESRKTPSRSGLNGH